MKLLLPAIQTALRAGLTGYLAATTDCYTSPTTSWQPDGVGLTAIGISSAGIDRSEMFAEMTEVEASVELTGYVPMTTDGATAVTAVYTLLDAATALLVDNLLGVSGLQSVEVLTDSETTLEQAPSTDELVKMIRTLKFTIERSGGY